MNKRLSGLLVALLLAVIAGCSGKPLPAENTPPAAARQFKNVRPAAVAGVFYPADQRDLKRLLDRLLAEAKGEPVPHLRALVCPHAGYEYSGPVAAVACKQLAGRHFSTVMLLGPSHYARFAGALVSPADGYQTPLGIVAVSPLAGELAKITPFSAAPVCEVERPDWYVHSPRKAPPLGEDTPETWEHSLEVELPFLQATLGDFSAVPVVYGDVDPKKVAQRLAARLDDQTLVFVSSDLSHYEAYRDAQQHDRRTVTAICDLEGDELTRLDACGYEPVVTLIELAKRKGWKARLLDYRNSGDTTGSKAQVVGYAAIAFFAPNGETAAGDGEFSSEDRRRLLTLARNAITAAANGREAPAGEAPASEKLHVRRACFVTLTKGGALRGCIGTLVPQEPLYEAVPRRAKAAAIEDTRFSPLQPAELNQIQIEISVLSLPQPLQFASPEDLLTKLRPKIDGVVLRAEGHSATYLPQVWEQLSDKQQFMNELARKAGLADDAWRLPGAEILTYQAEAFQEAENGE